MPKAVRAETSAVQRRPRDRKAQIARVSADAFSELGYHAVSMEEIASRVGISAAALYRHSPSKYDLFRDAVLALGQQLVDCTEDADAGGEPAATLDRLTTAIVDTAIANRGSGGLYRWEGRYLNESDQQLLAVQIETVNRRLQEPLSQLRPDLTSRQRWTLSSAALSVVGSVTDHRSPLPVAELRATLKGFAAAVLSAEFPDGSGAADRPASTESLAALALPGDAGKYEALLRESLMLFHKNGFRETSMEDIAGAVGIQASGIYRFFPSKGDMLAASYRRAADRISGDLANIVATESDPYRAMMRLVDAYVARSFRDPEIAYVYYTERANLPEVDRAILRNIQRSVIEAWTRLLGAARPELSSAQARFAVHASFALVVDLGRLVHYDDTPYSQACVRRMMEVTLFGLPPRAEKMTEIR